MESKSEIQSNLENQENNPWDVVVVLGGNIRPTKNRGWVTTSFVEGPEKSIGAHSRTIAAAELYRKGLAKNFIVCTGKTTPSEDAPTEAAIMKKELVKYGVPESSVIEEDISLNTIENLQEAAKIIREHDFKKVAVMTSDWHLPRTKVLTEPTTKSLEAEGRQVEFIACEPILEKRSPRYQKIISKVYSRDTMHERLQREQSGIRAYREGIYQSKPGDKN